MFCLPFLLRVLLRSAAFGVRIGHFCWVNPTDHMASTPLVALRHELHRHPELSGQETDTARRLVEFVWSFAPSRVLTGLGGTGVAVVYEFGAGGPTLLFRSELDAMPIQEINTFAHRSVRAGVSHKYGHDGHAATLAGLAPWPQARTY